MCAFLLPIEALATGGPSTIGNESAVDSRLSDSADFVLES
jgi:hypothetical protein